MKGISRAAICCLYVLIAVSFANSSFAESRPNVLFIAVDDMKDWVNCLGGYEGTVHTPNIDRLAARGTLFTNAHCASPKCAPSRAAIMTGLMPSTTGLYDNGHWWLPNLPNVVTLPSHFRNHGYQVVGAGKIFHHTAGNNPPNQWDDYLPLRFRDDPWFRASKLNYPWSQHSKHPPGFPFCGFSGLPHENDWGSPVIAERDLDDVRTTQYAIDYLAQSHEKPFFLACGIFRPHLPWYVPKRFFEQYPLDEIVMPQVKADDLQDIPADGKALASARNRDLHKIRDAGKYRDAIQAYLASISFADEQLGRVLDALDNSTHRSNTVVVFWSDHGWHLGEKGHWHKSTLWEEATRVPLIISAPKIAAAKCARPVSLVDLFPTLIDLCDLPEVASHDGVSLVPLLHDPHLQWERPAVTEFRHGNASVRGNRFRYIRYAGGGEELYDHANDPREWTNLADDPASAKERKHLGAWIKERWAPSAPTKKAFEFDPTSFVWTRKADGTVTRGK